MKKNKNKETTEETYELERPREIKIYKSPVYKVLGTRRPAVLLRLDASIHSQALMEISSLMVCPNTTMQLQRIDNVVKKYFI